MTLKRLWDKASKPLRRGNNGFVTVGVIVTVLGAMGVTLVGAGAAQRTLDVADGNFWLWSDSGELGRVNAEAGKVDLRRPVADSRGHKVRIEESDKHLVLHDLTSGTISTLDLSSLEITSQVEVPSDISVSVHNDVALIVDTTRGVVTRLDPDTLKVVGQPLQLPRGLINAGFDDKGLLWVAAPTEGTVVGVSANKDDKRPRVAHTAQVAEADSKLKLSVLDSGVAVVDYSASAVTTVRGEKKTRVAVPTLTDPTVVARTGNGPITITDAGSRTVVVVDGTRVRSIAVSGKGELGDAMHYHGRLYVADNGNRSVAVFDDAGTRVQDIRVPESRDGGTIELRLKEGYLSINAPGSNTARLVDSKNKVTILDKQPKDVAGAPARPGPTGNTPTTSVASTGDTATKTSRPEPTASRPSASSTPSSGPTRPSREPSPTSTSTSGPAPSAPTAPARPKYAKSYGVNKVVTDSAGRKLATFSGNLTFSEPNGYDSAICVTDQADDKRNVSFVFTYTYTDGTIHTTRRWSNVSGPATRVCHEAWVHWGTNIDRIQITYSVDGLTTATQTVHNGTF